MSSEMTPRDREAKAMEVAEKLIKEIFAYEFGGPKRGDELRALIVKRTVKALLEFAKEARKDSGTITTELTQNIIDVVKAEAHASGYAEAVQECAEMFMGTQVASYRGPKIIRYVDVVKKIRALPTGVKDV